jgi:hypothetical protein
MRPTTGLKLFFIGLISLISIQQASAQAELKPYGNLEGIRIKGQLMPFYTRIAVVGKDGKKVSYTAKEKQRPKFERNGDEETVNTQIDSLHFTETVKDIDKGSIRVTITVTSHEDAQLEGIYFNVGLPKLVFNDSQFKADKGNEEPVNQRHLGDQEQTIKASSLSFTAAQSFEIKTASVTPIIFKPEREVIRFNFPIHSGNISNGDTFQQTYDIKVAGDIDQTPANLQLNTSEQGRMFAGFGGNFRLQNPKADPEVIDYCLQNMRVAWGRVEMPWSTWQPDTTVDPTKQDTAQLNIRIRKAMLMAQRLNQMNIPVILTAWFPPQWAVIGKLNMVPTPQGIWGNPLNPSVMPRIYQSITDYILYLKAHYGVEVTYFSFNESDLGINIRQTGEEHDELIKGLGAYFASKGLKTKMLLGDNSDATTYNFIYPAMNDPQAKPYIGAISFHSWRGWTTEILKKWADAAKQTNLPLIVGEGSIDAAAWGYPRYFQEQSYALEEINLYTRLLAICQPLSILQWQLTSDYSPLKGGGIFGDDGPLEPTQRFWNLKQLASTPKDLYAMPISNNNADISCAALGDNNKHVYTIHLVNNGTEREVHLSGVPSSVKKFDVYITNIKSDMKHKTFSVKDGICDFKADQRSFVTLISK